MDGPNRAAGRSALTPAVMAAAAFAALTAVASIAFVAARGGLELPTVTSPAPVAVASATPATPTAPTSLSPTPAPPSPTEAPSVAPPSPTGGPTPVPTPGRSPDPLLALPGCADHPGCYVYTVRRGDSYTAISDRFGILLWIMDTLNPEITDKRVIVVGQAIYLGRDPTVRLDLCRDGTCHRYAVQSGDTLSAIAGRYGLTVPAIVAINPGLDPGVIVAGDVIRLPFYSAG